MNNDSKCWLCKCPINEGNTTKEHIIPNAIGGRRTVKGVLCRTCNSTTGERWDAELVKQLKGTSKNASWVVYR